MSHSYFIGDPANMGRVTALPEATFADLVDNVVRHPVAMPMTQSAMFALPEKEQNERKKTKYLVPAVFKTSPSPRQTGSATHCNVLFNDVDDTKEASRMLNAGWEKLLGNMNAVVWHTARSTPERPRLRIMVAVRNLPINHYGAAATALAGLLGMSAINHESKVAVQPMYLPVQYKGSTFDPVIYVKTDGQDFDVTALGELENLPKTNDGDADADGATMGDIEYLRSPVDNITKEEIVEALEKVDANCSMQQWIEIGMSLKHQFGDEGFTIWDDWSATAKSKYPGQTDTKMGTVAKWESFVQNPKDRVPITIRSVIKVAVESGWNNRSMTTRLFDSCRDWIRNPSRSSEELLDQGAKRIAKLGAVIGPLEQKVLVSDLHSTTKSRGLRGPSVIDISKEVKRLSNAAMRAATVHPLWAKGMVFLTAPNLFYRVVDGRKMRGDVVDLIYKSPNPEISAKEYLVHEVGIPVAENLRYDPSTKSKHIDVNGVPYINTYRASYPEPDPKLALDAGALWIEHAKNLVGEKHWITLTDYLAYNVQHPGKKIRWLPLIQSGVGAGKGLIAHVIQIILGQPNVQRLAAEHVLEGSHNGWAAGFQLTVMDEVRIVGHNRHRVMDKFKPLISDDQISVRNLYEPVQTVPNVTNYIMFTNYQDALAVHADDRRYWVLFSPLQTRAQIAALSDDYFDRMYRGFTQLAPGLRAFFEAWPISKDFQPEGRAPVTSFLRDLTKQTASPLARAVAEVLEDEPHPLVRKDIVSLTALRSMLPTGNLPPFTDQALAACLREEGFTSMGRHMLDGARHTLWSLDTTIDVAARAQERLDVL